MPMKAAHMSAKNKAGKGHESKTDCETVIGTWLISNEGFVLGSLDTVRRPHGGQGLPLFAVINGSEKPVPAKGVPNVLSRYSSS